MRYLLLVSEIIVSIKSNRVHFYRVAPSQNAVFKYIIPSKEGLCIELDGKAFSDVGSPHYEAHRIMEEFWDQYRDGGSLEGKIPSIGEYNRALYDSLVGTGEYSLDDIASAVLDAYRQQRNYGLTNSDDVPRIPGKIYQKK